MGIYEQQIQSTAQSYYPEMGSVEQSGREILSSGVPGNEPHGYDWADVLRELDPWY